jgi:hypothetical protein
LLSHFDYVYICPDTSRLDAVLDLYGLPMIITGMYTHGVDELYETLIPNLEAPHGM